MRHVRRKYFYISKIELRQIKSGLRIFTNVQCALKKKIKNVTYVYI